MKKIAFLALALVLLATPGMCEDKTYTVSISQIVEHPALDALQNGFKERILESGVQAEFNVHVAQGNPSLNTQIAAQILGENPDLVLGIATPSAQALATKIKNVPILFTGVTDPVAAGLVDSLENPGGNITGMTDMSPVNRQIDLMLEFMPDIETIGVMYNAGEANSVVLYDLVKEYCDTKGIDVVEATVINSAAVYQAAKSLVGRVDAVYIPVDNTVVSALESAVKVSNQSDLPMFCADVNSVERGCVAALAIDYYRMGLQTGDMAVRILAGGAKPADMPVESLQNLELWVNENAAAEMDVTVPDAVMERADKILK